MKKRSISSFIQDEYKSYSKYVLEHRAIPSVIDGFKMVQRKAFFLLRNQKSFIKVASVGGELISKAGYNHGDASANSAVSLMAQDFAGGNNLPLFEGKGSFGSRFIQEPAAARYIYVRANKVIPYLYKDMDLCPTDPDPEYPEARYYLPIIPTVLLNGVKGIAVGFATDIPPHSPLDLIRYTQDTLNGKKPKPLTPQWIGYTGERKREDGKWIQLGVVQDKGKYYHITEVPTSYDRERYIKVLDKLEDDGMISGYEDQSKENWSILVWKKRGKTLDPRKDLKLYNWIGENITTLDQNGDLKIFESPGQVADYFIEFRLGVYEERRRVKISELEEQIRFLNEKIRFIKEALEISWKGKSLKDIQKEFKEKGFNNKDLVFFLKLEIYRLNIDYIKSIQKDLRAIQSELEYYRESTAQSLYLTDLSQLEEFIKKHKLWK